MFQRQNMLTLISIMMVVVCGSLLVQLPKRPPLPAVPIQEQPTEQRNQEMEVDVAQNASQMVEQLTGIVLDEALIWKANLIEGQAYHLQTTREYWENSSQLSTELTPPQAKQLGFLTDDALTACWKNMKLPADRLTVAFRTFLPEKQGARLHLVTLGADLSGTDDSIELYLFVRLAPLKE